MGRKIVRANWRVIFRFDGEAENVDYVDYTEKEQTHDHEEPAAPRRRRVTGMY